MARDTARLGERTRLRAGIVFGAAAAMLAAEGHLAARPPTVYTRIPQIGVWSPSDPGFFYSYGGGFAFAAGGYPIWYWGYPSNWTFFTGPTVLYFNRAALPPPMIEITRRIDPDTQRMTPVLPESMAPPPPPADEGLEALRAQDFERAITVYERRHQERLTQEASAPAAPPPDRRALRLLGLALAGAGRFDEAAEVLDRAQKEDSGLDSQPIDGTEALGSQSEMRRIVLAAVRHAQRVEKPAAWRLVARLMQAEGRDVQAQRMFERAADLERSASGAPPSTPPASTPAIPGSTAPSTPSPR